MTYDRSLFSRIHDQKGGKSVELGDDATYYARRVGSISLRTPTSDILELNNVLYVSGLKKNLLSISCVADLHCMAKFYAREVIFKRETQVVAKGIHVEGLYKLLVDSAKHVALVHDGTKLCQ